MAEMADLVYQHEKLRAVTLEEDEELWCSQQSLVDVVDVNCNHGELKQKGGGFAFVAKKDKQLVIAFAGTDFTDANDLAADMKSLTGTNVQMGKHRVNLGKGFNQQYQNIKTGGLWAAIEAVGAGSENEQHFEGIDITGHSLGGALANVCAVDVVTSFPWLRDKVHLWTFGSPRVFMKASASLVHSEILNEDNIHRFANYGDTIPSTPQGYLGFRHVGKAIYVNYEMRGKKMTHSIMHQDFSAYNVCGCSCMGPSSKVSNHFITFYRARIAGYIDLDAKKSSVDSKARIAQFKQAAAEQEEESADPSFVSMSNVCGC